MQYISYFRYQKLIENCFVSVKNDLLPNEKF
jgi:hypothetical protein